MGQSGRSPRSPCTAHDPVRCDRLNEKSIQTTEINRLLANLPEVTLRVMGRKSRDKRDRVPASATELEPAGRWWGRQEWMISGVLVALIVAVFGQVESHSFLNYDDGQFIFQNDQVMRGLSLPSIRWALTSTNLGWYPLTWLSHMLDVDLWGLRAGMHLLTNVAVHAITTCLLFAAIRRLTEDTAGWRSAFVAALFAIHPMHVESVAWASERKDTLSTLWIVLALLLYARNPQRRWPVALAFAASLASKQTYVTFPLLLLILDFWPLGRIRTREDLSSTIRAKLPFIALAIGGAVMAVIGQHNINAIQSVSSVPIGQRLCNAAVSVVTYLSQMVVPRAMALPVPAHPVDLVLALLFGGCLFAVTAAAIVTARSRPALVAGWSWYLITLLPVAGLVQIGRQARADRYTYFAFIGLFLAIAFDPWWRRLTPLLAASVSSAVVLIFAAVAFHQVRYWQSSETLFTHTLAVTRDNTEAEYLLGQSLELSDPDRAIPHLRRAAQLIEKERIRPDWHSQIYVSLGTSMLVKARALPVDRAREQWIRDAIAQYRHSLVIDPAAPHATNNLAVASQMLAQPQPAPGEAEAASHLQAGAALSRQNHPEDAVAELEKAVRLVPKAVEPHVYLALALVQAHHLDAAVAELEVARQLNPRRSNELVTSALRLQPGPGNLDALIEKLRSG